MSGFFFTLCALAAGCYIAVVGALLIGWGGHFSLPQRISLGLSASGIVGAGIPRLMGNPPGAWDFMFLGGLVAFFVATYGPAIFRNLDGLDGVFDGRFHFRRNRP
jgi:hypothetical protein